VSRDADVQAIAFGVEVSRSDANVRQNIFDEFVVIGIVLLKF
jgi:hypothetical protein